MGGNKNAGRYWGGGQEGPWVSMYVFYHVLIRSTLLSFSFFFFSIASFSAEYNDRRDGMGRDRCGQRHKCGTGREWGGQRVRIVLFFARLALLCPFFFSLLLCSNYLCAATGGAGARLDTADANGNRNVERCRGVNGYVSCYFLLSTLFLSSSHFSSFLLRTRAAQQQGA